MVKTHERPIVGDWYEDLDHDISFEIVASDDVDESIDIQYFEGELEEIDFETWYNGMRLVTIPAPEDWTGPFDDLEPEDLAEIKNEVIHPTQWGDSVVLREAESIESLLY